MDFPGITSGFMAGPRRTCWSINAKHQCRRNCVSVHIGHNTAIVIIFIANVCACFQAHAKKNGLAKTNKQYRDLLPWLSLLSTLTLEKKSLFSILLLLLVINRNRALLGFTKIHPLSSQQSYLGTLLAAKVWGVMNYCTVTVLMQALWYGQLWATP